MLAALVLSGPTILLASLLIGWTFDRLNGGIFGYSYMTDAEYEEEVILRGWRGDRARKAALIKRYGKWMANL